MKIMNLTNVSVLLLALASISRGVTASESPSAKTWVHPEERIVYYAPKAALKLSLTHVGADDAYWDELDAALAFDGASAEQQAAELRAAYPGYQVRKAVVRTAGALTLNVPALSISIPLKTMPGQEGPYANYTAFISKAQSTVFAAAFAASSDPVKVVGDIIADIPQTQTVEHVDLEGACETLTGQGKTLFDTIRAYAEVQKLIDAKTYRFSETKLALERSVLENCVDIPFERGVGSFHEMLSLPATPKAQAVRPSGETQRQIPTSVTLPLSYSITKSNTGGGT